MFEGTNSTEWSESAVRAEHEERRKDLQYQHDIFWPFFLKLLAVFSIIIMILIALD